MKPMISYYGGKQRIATRIVSEVDTIPHKVYVEPFAGGAAVLFAKGARNPGNRDDYREVLNDNDERIVTLYRVCQEQKADLVHLLAHTPYSRSEYKRAASVLKVPHEHSDLRVAWATVVQTRQSFANGIGKGWGIAKKSENSAATWATYLQMLPAILDRLNGVFIECEDALRCIKRWDSPDTLFYCDPPYPGTDQGHYSGYALDDWRALCNALDACQGSYILSGYAQDVAPTTAAVRKEIAAHMSARNNKNTSGGRSRTEILWIRNRRKGMFDALD